jgi:hypothetical protein
MDSSTILEAPVSGIWHGWARKVRLAHRDPCGKSVDLRESDAEPLWAVLFFDDDTVSGHATQGASAFSLGGWWGPSKHLRPIVSQLGETDLWGSGSAGLQLQLGEPDARDVCFAWIEGDVLTGYRRKEGG